MNARAGAVKRYTSTHTTKYKRGTSEGKVAKATATRSACGDVRGGAGDVEMSAIKIFASQTAPVAALGRASFARAPCGVSSRKSRQKSPY